MTANLNIIVDERENVLTVPNRADQDGQQAEGGHVLFEGQQIQTPVQTGLSSDSLTEIVSGLKEGDVVVVNGTTTATTSTTQGAGHGRMGTMSGGAAVGGTRCGWPASGWQRRD